MTKKALYFLLTLLVPLLGVPVGMALASSVRESAIPYCFLGTVFLCLTLPAALAHFFLHARHPHMRFNLGLSEGLCAGSLVWIVVASLINFRTASLENWGLVLLGLASLVAWILHRRAKRMQNRRTQLPGMVLGVLLSPLYLLLFLLLAFHRPLGG